MDSPEPDATTDEVQEPSILSIKELFEVSEEATKPRIIELINGKGVMIVPVPFVDAVEMLTKYDVSNADARSKIFTEYFAETFVNSIIEPDMTDEERARLKAELLTWPSDLMNNVMGQFYRETGVTGGEIEERVKEVADFFGRTKEPEVS